MRAFNLRLSIAALAVCAAWAAEEAFKPPSLADNMHPQTTSGVTIGAKAYNSTSMVKQAFGKFDPVRYGLLPVYVVIENKSQKSIDLTRMKAEYISVGGDRVDATPSGEVRYVGGGPSKPNINPTPGIPYPRKVRVKQGPLSDRIFEERAFGAKALPPGDKAAGFLYFEIPHRGGSTLYISGLKEAATGQELIYVEVPLEE